jgi:zinc protease
MQREVNHSDRAVDSIEIVTHPPTTGSVRTERSLVEVGAYDWTLSNGMRVILKPTRFTYDQLEFRFFAPGGASLADDASFPSAYYADEVIHSTGVGDLDGRRLGRRLDASSIDLSMSVDDAAIDFRGTAAPDDLELLFQVLHLYLTAPRADTLAFQRWHNRRISFATHREGDPDSAFEDSLAAAVSQHHPRTLRSRRTFVDRVELSRVLDFWRMRTANAANFTLVLTGDFTLDRVRALAARYLASLPGGTREAPRDEEIRFPPSVVRRAFRAGEGPRTRTSIVLSAPYELVEGSSEELSRAREAAELALSERLRETLGATYGVQVTASTDAVPPFSYRLTIAFESDAEHIDSLATVALRELERLRTAGPTETEAARVRASQTRAFDNRIDDNSYWADELSWHSRPGFALQNIAGHQAKARALTVDALREACRKYLGTARYVRVTMLPRRTRPHLRIEEPSAGEGGVGTGR